MLTSRQSRLNLMDLPTELHAAILSEFTSTPSYFDVVPSDCTIENSTWPFPKLSDDLLNAAKVSPRLAQAAVSALGSRVTILNNRSTARLAEWIHILHCEIKALSLTGSTNIGFCQGECEQEECTCNHLYDETIEILKALSTNEVKLEVLNLEDLVLIRDEKAAEIEDCLTRAMQKSGLYLKEIALNANLVNARALKHVNLPRLEVAEITFEDLRDKQFERMERRSSAESYREMLRALNGHVDRIENKSSLRELRLYGVYESLDVDRETCASLFLAVEKLILICEKGSNNSSLADFIVNFKNLRILSWCIEATSANDMNKIFQECIFLDEIVLNLAKSDIFTDENGAAQVSPMFRNPFASFRGKLQSLEVRSYLTSGQLNVFGQNCPKLTTLITDIGPRNLEGFHSLLETHCRNLRELRLLYLRSAQDCLGPDGWMAFSKAICSASDHLSKLYYMGDRSGPMAERAITDMIQAIAKILKFMNNRAEIVLFQVPMESDDPKKILAGLKYALHASMTHCKSLDYLCLDFLQESPGLIAVDEAEAYDIFYTILKMREQYEASENAHEVEFGRIVDLLQNPSKIRDIDGSSSQKLWLRLGHSENAEESDDAMEE